ncbi:MAG: hypothetical protein HIU82_00985 [Proteobacteria bacterium]|jgi:hypothetical protein|nr:hypothetical protein [Pseudomonadota bacterium]
MLAGEAVVAIWNGIAPELRGRFYDWHNNEHMPERVGIPGFRRGRRMAAAGSGTAPEFFTLYEADSLPVVTGVDYAARLNDPTPATRAITAEFRTTTRALAAVVESRGPGMGGVMGTLRFDAESWLAPELRTVVRSAATLPRVTGAHLCRTDLAASGVRTTETRDRADLDVPPAWFVLVEASDPEALALADLAAMLVRAGARVPIVSGCYRLEYVRSKMGFAV